MGALPLGLGGSREVWLLCGADLGRKGLLLLGWEQQRGMGGDSDSDSLARALQP